MHHKCITKCIIFDAFGDALLYCVPMQTQLAECPKCHDSGDSHGLNCIVRKIIFERDFKGRSPRYVSREEAMRQAIEAIEKWTEKRERKKMETQNAVAVKPKKQLDVAVVESFMIQGDINRMNDEQVTKYIRKLCEVVAINPITRPFDIMVAQGKKVIYANKGCAEQLRNIWSISIRIVKREVVEGVYVVTAAAQMPDGRVDESTGCVWIDGLKGDHRANAMMKAETKAKRRVTLSICGLNMPDDSEVETIPGASKTEPKKLSQPQIARLFALSKEVGISSKDELKERLGIEKSLTELTHEEYESACRQIEEIKLNQMRLEPETPQFPAEPEIVVSGKPQAEELPWEKYLK